MDPPKHLNKAVSCRIVKEGRDRYYAVFTFKAKKPVPKIEKVQKLVYLDPNIKNFAYGLDTEGHAFEIPNMSWMKDAEHLSDLLKASRDKCEKKSLWVDTVHQDGSVSTHTRPSREWYKRNQVLERHEAKVRDQKKHFQYALANRLCAAYDEIGIGDYVPENTDHLKGRKYNRAMRNRTMHGSFKKVLLWVAKRSGKKAVVIDESGTTRTCHVCGHVVEGGIHPLIREWDCPGCRTIHHRDENACQNGLRRYADVKLQQSMYDGCDPAAQGLQSPLHTCREMSCSDPVQIIERCDWNYHPQGWGAKPLRESASAQSIGDSSVNQKQPPENRRKWDRTPFQKDDFPVSTTTNQKAESTC